MSNIRKKNIINKKNGIIWNQDLKLWFINKCKIRKEEICNIIYLGKK